MSDGARLVARGADVMPMESKEERKKRTETAVLRSAGRERRCASKNSFGGRRALRRVSWKHDRV